MAAPDTADGGTSGSEPIAVIGMAGRFPGAGDLDRFWTNLCDGVESITHFSADELIAHGRDPALVRHPAFVGAEGVIDGYDLFDAEFFGYAPREAEVMDPQHRLCLETAWQAVNSAGYDPAHTPGPVGVYLAASLSSYLIRNLLPNQRMLDTLGGFPLLIHNDKDFLATTVSHKLGLTGPSMAVGTACSSSLVAIHLACQSLLSGECDLALAGGVSLQVPAPQGYLYRDDGIYSPDGHCRAFGADAHGTVGGSGVAVVLLRRWRDAVRDGDHIHAVILGSAVNNDGAAKAGYTAPGVDGQTAVIAEALTVAGVTAEAVGYVEAHGTGTALGDLIEIEALTRAYRRDTDRRGYCAVGSVKSNIGHLDSAAGVAGFVKAALAVERAAIPASLHCERPNEKIDFGSTPFVPNPTTVPWPAGPRISGVSSFGIGGTNAHVVVAQAPAAEVAPAVRRAPVASPPLRRKRFWIDPPPASPAHAAARTPTVDLTTVLSDLDPGVSTGTRPDRGEADLDRLCAALAAEYLDAAGVDLAVGTRYPVADLRRRLRILPQFTRMLDYLLAVLVEDGVLRRDGNALTVVDRHRAASAVLAADLVRRHPARRGLVELLLHCASRYPVALSTPGAALATLYPDGRSDLLRRTLGEPTDPDDVDRALATLTRLARRLARHRAPQPLRVLEVGAGGGRLTAALATALVGDRPDYLATDISPLFVAHLADEASRRGLAVRTGVLDISRPPTAQGFEPGSADLVVGLDVVHATPDVRASLRHLYGLLAPGGVLGLVETTARHRWLSLIWGLSDGWWSFTDDLRTELPLLRPHQWQAALTDLDGTATTVLPVAPDTDAVLALTQAPPPAGPSLPADLGLPSELPPKQPTMDDWCYTPGWRRSPVPATATTPGPARSALLFTAGALGDAVAARLRALGLRVTVARPAGGPGPAGTDDRLVDPADPQAYRDLVDELSTRGERPDLVAHLWHAEPEPAPLSLESVDHGQLLGLHSLLFLAQALGPGSDAAPIRLLAATTGAQHVVGEDVVRPDLVTVHAAVKIIPREYPTVRGVGVDLPHDTEPDGIGWLADRIRDELLSLTDTGPTVAYRGGHRWLPTVEAVPMPPLTAAPDGLRPGGVYLVCGGLGGIGLTIAEHLAALPATVVLTGRSPFPGRAEWPAWLADHSHTDETSRVIRRLAACEAAGGTVVVAQADITSLPQMRAVVDTAAATYGPITGVVHAAGIADRAGMIQRRTRADTDAAVAAKITGTLVLRRALAGHRPAFVVLCASIANVLYKLKFGEVGYLAGHEFLNAYAAAGRWADGTATIAVSWTDWLEAGMWAQAQHRLADRYTVRDVTTAPTLRPDSDLLRGITGAEGIELFRRIVGHRPASQVVVSTQHLDRLLEVHGSYSTAAHRALLDQLSAGAAGGARPALATPYAEPRTATHHLVAEIWRDVLGVDGVGIDDDFFELGGDSLIALRLLSDLRERTGVDHPFDRFFDAPTIRAVADDVEAATTVRPSRDDPGFEEIVI